MKRTDGEGESYTVSFCERDDPPAPEILTVLSWDKDDTDVDTHIYSNGESAYYSMSQSWGDLDIDDVDGFGPRTFTRLPDTANGEYESRFTTTVTTKWLDQRLHARGLLRA